MMTFLAASGLLRGDEHVQRRGKSGVEFEVLLAQGAPITSLLKSDG